MDEKGRKRSDHVQIGHGEGLLTMFRGVCLMGMLEVGFGERWRK